MCFLTEFTSLLVFHTQRVDTPQNSISLFFKSPVSYSHTQAMVTILLCQISITFLYNRFSICLGFFHMFILKLCSSSYKSILIECDTRKQLLNDLKVKREHWEINEEAFGRAVESSLWTSLWNCGRQSRE